MITSPNVNSRPARRGLAMLEMVLALPILLMVMALIVNYGAVATWKIRGLVAARHVVWSSRAPRTPDAFPPPFGSDGIPQIQTGGPSYARRLDDLPALHQPAVRGPLPLGNRVNADLLNCNRGLQSGHATIDRRFPLLSSMGPYHLHARTEILSGGWQFGEMGLRHNRQRRVPVIYDLAKAPGSRYRAYVRAVDAILAPDLQQALRALDHDDEFIGYGRRFAGSALMPWGDTAPDFHPMLDSFCTWDPRVVQYRVDSLVQDVAAVPKNLARGFTRLYERAIKELEWRITNDPSLPPGQSGRRTDEIVQLMDKIDVLDTFLQSLPGSMP